MPNWHCIVCGTVVGGKSYQPPAALRAFLEDQNLIRAPARQGATSYLCQTCGKLRETPRKLRAFADMVAAGQLFTAMRLYPEQAVWDHPSLSQVRRNMLKESFCSTKHGSAHYRTDRCSLFLYGPLRHACRADVLSFVFSVFFAAWFATTARPSSFNFPVAVAASHESQHAVRPSDWSEGVALDILTSIWRPGRHDSGD